MTMRLAMTGVLGLVLLAGCEGGTMGAGTNLGGQQADVDIAATTPEGVLETQLADPSIVSECLAAAQRIEATTSTEVERQAAIEDRQRLGCPE